MVQKVIKYGNSLAVVIAKDEAAAVGIEAGTLIQATVEDGRLVVQPVEVVPKLSPELRQLVDEVYEQDREVFEALGE